MPIPPLRSVPFPPQRFCLARSRSLCVFSRFFFTVLYNRQSPVLRRPGPESPAVFSLSLSLSLFLSLFFFRLSRACTSLSPLAASIPGRYFGFANVHVSAKILLNPILTRFQTGFRLTPRKHAGGGRMITARDVARHEPFAFFVFFVAILAAPNFNDNKAKTRIMRISSAHIRDACNRSLSATHSILST